jgi:hypothetical protein
VRRICYFHILFTIKILNIYKYIINNNFKFNSSYSLGTKHEAIRLANEFGTSEASRKIGIHAKLISAWVKDQQHILSQGSIRGRCRLDGGGRKTPYAPLENRLFNWVKDQRAKRFNVSYTSLRNKALAVKDEVVNCTNFRASHTWLRGFLSRNGLSYRTPTHVAQQNNKSPELK